MNKMQIFKKIITVFAIGMTILACGNTNTTKKPTEIIPKDSVQKDEKPPEYFTALKKAYPNYIQEFDSGYLVWTDGTRMLWDDGKEKSFDELLNSPDPEDQFAFAYPKNFNLPPKHKEDPGRIRCEAFFKKMYGESAAAVEKNLVKIQWLPSSVNKSLRFSKINGAADSLQAVAKALDSLPHLHKYVNAPAGTFYWRFISGTERLSMHSFGIALDINIDYFNYWKWDLQQGKDLQYKNRVPQELTEIFERHGFIWGGKWHHYDTGHFEFRPEFFHL